VGYTVNEITQEVTRKAGKAIHLLGWKRAPGHGNTVRALNYPYAFYFGKCRKMISVRMTQHPDLDREGFLSRPRMDFPLGTTPQTIARELEKKYLPRVIATTDRLLREGILREAL